jgi:hypothetical protein
MLTSTGTSMTQNNGDSATDLTSIPVLGSAIVNGVDWIRRQIRSIDYPVDRYILINNNGRGELDHELNDLMAAPHAWIKKLHVVHMPSNIGCAGAWNLIIKSSMLAPYWIICGHDVAFHAGFLEKFAAAASDQRVGMVHGSAGGHGQGSWSLFSIRDWVIQEYGLFDENFYPAYVEDIDYVMRLIKRPIRRVILDQPYMHGHSDNDDYATQGSQTWRTDSALQQGIDWAREINETKYCTEKWGPGWRWMDPHWRPWNEPKNDLGDWCWDLEFCRSKHLGF